MAFQLQSLLDLRRNTEEAARQALILATAIRRREEDRQQALRVRWLEARAKVDDERKRAAARLPTRAAQAMTNARYLAHLEKEAKRLRDVAENHRKGALADAAHAEAEARSALADAHAEHAALVKLKERASADEKRIAQRRADDNASDFSAWRGKR